MRLILKICKVLVALFIMLSAGYLLSYSNLIESAKGMGKRTPKITITCLGSVPMEASLADLVPAKEKEIIRLKERWLKTKADIYNKTVVSENGKYKVLRAYPGQRVEGAVEATFVDSNGEKIWSAVVGENVYVSNNGRNIAATSLSFPHDITFYDVRKHTEPIATAEFQEENAFSYNGEYFISAGSKLILRGADGTLIWEKDTGTQAYKKVAISSDGSYIVMASKAVFGEPEPKITDVIETQKEQKTASTPLRITSKDKKERIEALKRQPREKNEKKSSNKPTSLKTERKLYLSFLRHDATLINQIELPYVGVREIVMSCKNGDYTAVFGDATLFVFHTKTGILLLRYDLPSPNWLIISADVTFNSDVIAIGVMGCPKELEHRERHVYLLDKKGSAIDIVHLPKQILPKERGPIVAFTEDAQFLLIGTQDEKSIYEISFE